VDGHSDSAKGHDIYFRLRGGPQPISRKWHFRGPTFPESNNTESSFNKGSATIYRGHASHSHLSASTAYIAIPPPVLSSILPQPPATPFIPVRSCVRTHPRRSPPFPFPIGISFVDTRIFFSQSFFLSFSYLLSLLRARTRGIRLQARLR